MLGPSVTPKNMNPQLWSPKPAPKYKRNSPPVSTRPSGEPTKGRAASQPNGDHMVEEEALLTKEARLEEGVEVEEEATRHQDLQEAHHLEETPFPLGPTSPTIYDPSPALSMLRQWENSPTPLTETEPKQKRSSTSSTIISCLTSTSRDLTPQSTTAP